MYFVRTDIRLPIWEDLADEERLGLKSADRGREYGGAEVQVESGWYVLRDCGVDALGRGFQGSGVVLQQPRVVYKKVLATGF